LPRDHGKIGRRLGVYHHKMCDDLVAIFIDKGFISQQDVRSIPDKICPTENSTVQNRTDKEQKTVAEEPVKPNQNPNGRPTPLEIFEFWNLHCGQLPKARALSEERKKKCTERLSHPGNWAKDFFEAVPKAASTPFLLGQTDRGWKADFDWIIRNDVNVLRILEGKYDGGTRLPVITMQTLWEKPDQKACEEHAEFVRGLGEKAPPAEKEWLKRWEAQRT